MQPLHVKQFSKITQNHICFTELKLYVFGSGNRLTYSTDITDEMKIAFARITRLNMTSMNLTWREVNRDRL